MRQAFQLCERAFTFAAAAVSSTQRVRCRLQAPTRLSGASGVMATQRCAMLDFRSGGETDPRRLHRVAAGSAAHACRAAAVAGAAAVDVPLAASGPEGWAARVAAPRRAARLAAIEVVTWEFS